MRLILEIMKKSLLPIIIVLLVAVAHFLYTVEFKFLLSEDINKYIDKGTTAILILIFALWLQRICAGCINWYRSKIAVKTETRLDEEFIPLLNRA